MMGLKRNILSLLYSNYIVTIVFGVFFVGILTADYRLSNNEQQS